MICGVLKKCYRFRIIYSYFKLSSEGLPFELSFFIDASRCFTVICSWQVQFPTLLKSINFHEIKLRGCIVQYAAIPCKSLKSPQSLTIKSYNWTLFWHKLRMVRFFTLRLRFNFIDNLYNLFVFKFCYPF